MFQRVELGTVWLIIDSSVYHLSKLTVDAIMKSFQQWFIYLLTCSCFSNIYKIVAATR